MIHGEYNSQTAILKLYAHISTQCMDYLQYNACHKIYSSFLGECSPGCQVFHILQRILETFHLLVSTQWLVEQ